MNQKKKKNLTILLIAVVIMLVSSILQAIIQTSGTKVKLTMLDDATNTGCVYASDGSKAIGDTGKEIVLTGKVVSGALFMPKDASATHKLPAIVLTHGYLNNWQKQYQNAIELSRRGFIVLAVDRSGHGDYTLQQDSEGFGGTTANYAESLRDAGYYLYNLDCVDRTMIGVSGHSMGGFATTYALYEDSGYKSGTIYTDANSNKLTKTYLGEGNGQLFSAGLIQAWSTFYAFAPQVKVGIIKSNDDEFFFKGTGDEYIISKGLSEDGTYTSRMWLQTKAAQNFVKISDPTKDVVSGHIYLNGSDLGEVRGSGAKTEGAFRVVYEANEIHTLNHFSITSAGNVVNFFYNAFGIPNGHEYIKESNQTWWVKEAISACGIVGFYMLFIPLCSLFLNTRFFSSLKRKEEEWKQYRENTKPMKGIQDWAIYILTGLSATLFAGFKFRDIINYQKLIWKVSSWFPQEHTNWVAYWCLVCGLFTLFVTIVFMIVDKLIKKARKIEEEPSDPLLPLKPKHKGDVAKAFVLAALVYGICLTFVWLIWVVFKVDFRLWLYTVKDIHVDKIPTAIRYVPIFFVFYLINSWSVAGFTHKNLPEWLEVLLQVVFNCLGITIVFCIQYITFKTTGSLWHTDMGTNYPTILTIIPILVVSTIYSKQLYKKTNNAWAAAFLTAIMAAFGAVSGASTSLPYTFI